MVIIGQVDTIITIIIMIWMKFDRKGVEEKKRTTSVGMSTRELDLETGQAFRFHPPFKTQRDRARTAQCVFTDNDDDDDADDEPLLSSMISLQARHEADQN